MMRFRSRSLLLSSLSWVVLALSACGGGGGESTGGDPVTPTPTPTPTGVVTTVSGLRAGTSLSVSTADGKVVELKADGSYTLASPTSSSGPAVRIEVQPTGQTCTLTPADTAGATRVQISCAATPTFAIGGTLTGLQTGASVTLLNNASDALTLNADGSFSFPTLIEAGHAYGVTVGTQPATQHCTVGQGTGAVSTAAVNNITVSCAALPTVGGNVTGLGAGYSLVLSNGADTVTLNGTGAAQTFRFATGLRAGTTYGVTVTTQPVLGANGQTCAITNGSGTMASAEVSNVSVACTDNIANRYSIGGTVSGLGSGTSLKLQNNAGTVLDVSANGSFIFPTQLASATPYAVTINTQPVGQTCTLGNATGTVAGANVGNVTVTCVARQYTVSATVSGLNSGTGGSLTLLNNGGNALAVSANGTRTFSATLLNNQTYAVSVGTQPTNGQTCVVSQPSGMVNNADVSSITVTCGTFSQFVLVPNSGSNNISVFAVDANTGALTASGAPVASGGQYPYAIVTDPNGKFAFVTNLSSPNVATFAINATTGALTLVSTVSADFEPSLLSMNAAGTVLYVANRYSGTVGIYSVNASTGALTRQGGYVSSGTRTRDVAVTPSGQFAYTTNFGANTITAFSVGSGGALTAISGGSYATGNLPYDLSIDPTGKFVYTVNYQDNTVSAFSINASTGQLTSIGTYATGNGPFSIAIDAAGRTLYVGNYGYIFSSPNTVGNNLSVYSINASTGALTKLGSDIPTGVYPNALALDATGRYLYVANANDDTLMRFTVNATDGTLTATGATVSTGRYPESFVVVRPLP